LRTFSALNRHSHRPRATCAARLLLLAAVCLPAAALALSWESPDGAYTVNLGARAQWDTDTFDGALNRGSDGDRRFNTQLRRARIELSGEFMQDFDWVFDVNINDDSASRSAEFHAVGLRYVGFSAFDIFVGRDKEPFGLEELISSKAIASIERSYFSEATDADAQPHYGVRLDGQVGPVHWSGGLFSPNGQPRTTDGGDRLATTARLFGAPLHDEERTLHLGLAWTDRNLDAPQQQSGFKLDIAEAGGELDSSSLLIRHDRQAVIELLYLRDAFSLQSEIFRKDMTGAAGGPDGQVDAWYLQATWAPTGEGRVYNPAKGITGTLKPAGPRGAIELVGKLDRIRFSADDRRSESATGYLAGINWYVNPHVKLMLNYIYVDSDNLTLPAEDSTAHVISTRMQFAF